jgi:hypothetical protein
VLGHGGLGLGRHAFFFFDEFMGLLGRKVFRLKTGLHGFALKLFPPRFQTLKFRTDVPCHLDATSRNAQFYA